MKAILLSLLTLLIVNSAHAQYILKSIESKRTKESITAFCDEYIQNECTNISIRYIYPKKNINQVLYKISKNGIKEETNIAQKVLYNMETEQMMKNKYKAFATYRKVCEMGWSGESNRNNFNDNSGCIMKTFFATAIFVGVGVLVSPGGAFALSAATKSLVLGGALSSGALSDLSIVQFFLFYPALAVDIARLFTVYPVKTLINKIRTRTLKRKIIPVIEEMAYELDNPATLVELRDEGLLTEDDYRVSEVKHRHFKKIKKFFMANEEK